MVNTPHVAILQGIDDLAEHMANESIAAEIDVLLGDHAKEVTLSKVHDEEDTIAFFKDAMEGDDACQEPVGYQLGKSRKVTDLGGRKP